MRQHAWRRLNAGAVLLVAAISSTGCVNRLSANVTPDANLGGRRNYHVVKHANDDNAINDLIATKLRAMGYGATTAAEGTPIPESTDTLVAYIDKWTWDMTPYMLELTIMLRDPQTDFPVASGNALHGSLTRRSPPEMVDEVLTEIFKGTKAP